MIWQGAIKILRENTQIQNMGSLHSLVHVMNPLHALVCVMNPLHTSECNELYNLFIF